MVNLTDKEKQVIEKWGHKTYTVNYLNWILNDDRIAGNDRPYWHAKGFYDAVQAATREESENER